MNDNNQWVDRRMALLDPAEGFAPNGPRAFARLMERDRHFPVARRNWVWGTAVASLACLVLLALPVRSLCCMKPADMNPDDAVPATTYRQSGSPTAPIVVEIYSDFECPACAVFYRDTYPLLVAQYVRTGKVKVVHRDFPLPMHPYAKLAARYANAAGEPGQYDLVFNRLFETQARWSADGNIEKAIEPVLTREQMTKVREKLANDLNPDDKVEEQITQTPTLVVVANGQRHKLAGAPSFTLLSAYLNELAAAQNLGPLIPKSVPRLSEP